MNDTILIQIKFSADTEFGAFSDILYFTPEEYAAKTKKDIDLIKQERVDNWVYLMNNPATFHEETAEEIQARLEAIEAEKLDLLEKQNNIEL